MFTRLVPIRLLALFVYGSFLIALSACKTAEIFLQPIYQLEDLLGGDKLMHLKLSAILATLALIALIPNSKDGLKVVLHAFGICLLLILGLMTDEFHQALISTRRFEWLDFAYGVSGIGIGLAGYLIGCVTIRTAKL